MSRLGLFINESTCEGLPKCSICAAADPENQSSGIVLNAIQDSVCLAQGYGQILEKDPSNGSILAADNIAFGLLNRSDDIQRIFEINFSAADKQKYLKYKLRTILEDSNFITTLQNEDKDLRRLRRDLKNEILQYPQKDRRLQTLLEVRNAKIQNNYIQIDKIIDGVVYRVIPLPSKYSLYAISAVHNTVGHSSATQLQKQVARYFQFDHLKDHVKKFTDSCIKCILLKNGPNYKNPDQKPVPIPDRFYVTILVDEVTRTFRGKNFKFLMGMEALSGFIICLAYEKAMTAELFIQMLAQLKVSLCPHSMDGVKMTVRCDRASWHTSNSMTITLKLMNIELQLYHSSSLSKNVIPELDSRIKIYSQYLVQLVEESPYDLIVCMHLAAAKTNNSIGKLGFTPAELFVNRSWKNDDQIAISTKELINSLKERRLARRLYENRKAAEKFQKRELKFIPYENSELNSPLVNNPGLIKIRPGDIVTLKESFNKNEPHYNYEVIKVDFKMNLVQIRRVSMSDTDTPKPLWVNFKILRDLIPKDNFNKICEYNGFDYDLQPDRSLPLTADIINYNDFILKVLTADSNILHPEYPSDTFHPSLSRLDLKDSINSKSIYKSPKSCEINEN